MNKFKLTTDHPASSYGMPVVIINNKAYGPSDYIEGQKVGDIVHEYATTRKFKQEELILASKFLRADPNGKQLSNVKKLLGRPTQFGKTQMIAARIPQEIADRCPRNKDGKISQDFIRKAIKNEVERIGL